MGGEKEVLEPCLAFSFGQWVSWFLYAEVFWPWDLCPWFVYSYSRRFFSNHSSSTPVVCLVVSLTLYRFQWSLFSLWRLDAELGVLVLERLGFSTLAVVQSLRNVFSCERLDFVLFHTHPM